MGFDMKLDAKKHLAKTAGDVTLVGATDDVPQDKDSHEDPEAAAGV